ncbi:MAG: ribonuclease D [Hyphomicrobiales bacterium]|nr:ribonuclease D [Hyphomicrobiales bacterium]|tara:strand:- start:772 stop:1872 length:1101 start_codon:yes stop_codon:yes gene_type:complete
MQIIDSQNKLDNFILNIRSETILGIDTEFVRERTYWPDLCLIQIATKNEEFIVDIKSNLTLDKLWDVLQDKKIVKLIHSCKQDIEAIFYLSGKIPTPIFDTQMAAMFCGFTDSISYAQLVKEILDIELDKDLQYSDWSERPLNSRKCEYAINDVRYLIDIHDHLNTKLNSTEKESWLYEEMSNLSRPPPVMDKEHPKSRRELLEKKFTNQDLVDSFREFRENIAILNNIPRKRIITDSDIAKIIEQRPKDKKDLNTIIGKKKYSVEDAYLTKILEILEENPFQNNDLNRLFKPKLSKSQKLVLRELNNQLRLISEKNQICSHLIANQSDLKRLVRKEHKDIKILSGWRYNLFGELACNITDHFANK